jgi:hypothetical protein
MDNSINEDGINYKFGILDKNIEDILKQVNENKSFVTHQQINFEKDELNSVDTKLNNELENVNFNFNELRNLENLKENKINFQRNNEDNTMLDTYLKYTQYYFKSIDSQICEIKGIVEKLAKEKEKKEIDLEKDKRNELNINKAEDMFFSVNEDYIKKKIYQNHINLINKQNKLCRVFEFEHIKKNSSKKFCNEKSICMQIAQEYEISNNEVNKID